MIISSQQDLGDIRGDGWPIPPPKRGKPSKYQMKCVTCGAEQFKEKYIGPHCLKCLNVLRDLHEKEEK